MTHSKHILLLNVYFAPHSYGGATVVAEAVARQLVAQHGYRVTAISTMDRPELVPYTVMRTEVGGIENHIINLPRDRSSSERYDNPEVTEIVARLIEDLAPDLVHAHCVQDLGVGSITAARHHAIPVILSVHDFWWLCERQFMIRPTGQYCGQDPIQLKACLGCVDNMARTMIRDRLLRATLQDADLITFPSPFARDLSVASGFPDAKSVVWENGVTLPGPDYFARQAARRQADPRLVFGFVGGPSQIKGWPLIKAAFKGLERADFAGLLVDASLDGTWWQGTTISDMQGDWQIHPRFSQDTMDAFYAKIDVLLFPSQWKETFGLTIREAAARGIRILQTDSGGTADWAGADRGAMLQIGDGAEHLREKVMQILATPDAHPAPFPVADYAHQAKEFTGFVAQLTGKNRP